MGSKSSFIESLNSGIDNIKAESIFADPDRLQEFDTHWSGLQYMGLELTFTENALLCNHRENGFQFSIPYEQASSDTLRRELFAELRNSFGNFSDRYFSAVLQPSRQVDTLFTSFRALLPACATIVRRQTGH